MAQRHPAIERLLEEHPNLNGIGESLQQALQMLTESFQSGGKLLLCGNGGSACDCEHIAGELMKGFLLPRPLNAGERAALAEAGDDGDLATHLQRALPVLVLQGLSGMSSAFLNDVRGDLTYAQQAFAYARPGDVLLGISTSGNAANVCAAAIAARARGAGVIGLTGAAGGRLASYCDICLQAPERETYRVQELHLPIYHALCIAAEALLFGGAQA
ncbi:MAG: SIS domain-containing protein [Clostridiales bacterium]|nr:SIS domain-containing protein [Clostridiales bacterium]